MLSPTWLAVRKAKFEEIRQKASTSNDVPALKKALAELTAVKRAYYGGYPNRIAKDNG